MLSVYNNSVKKNVNTNVEIGHSLSFSISYQYRIGNLMWDLGDGIRYYNKRNVTHTYWTSGTRDIICTINNKFVIKKKITVLQTQSSSSTIVEDVVEETDGISLNIINRSNDLNAINVVIFQKNIATSFSDTAVAWQLFNFTSSNQIEPLVYEYDLDISCQDSFSNFTPKLDANIGSKYEMTMSSSGNELILSGVSQNSSEIELLNSINAPIDGLIYRGNKLLARNSGISTGQSTFFRFNQTIFIGVVSGIIEGQVMDSSVLSSINTQISLLGIKSADVVMIGGGAGPSATPYSFYLENVVYS